MKHLLICTTACLLLFGSCATQTESEFNYEDTTSPDAKLYGDYLVGAYADAIEDMDARAHYYERAFDRAGDDLNLARRAVTSAVAAGDWSKARSIARDILSKGDEPMARAVLGAYAFSKGRTSEALDYLEDDTADLTVRILGNLIKGWAEVDKNTPEKAKEIFQNIGGGGYFDLMGQLQIANLEAAEGNIEEAEIAYALVESSNLSPTETTVSRVKALSLAGNDDAALTYLNEFIEEFGPFETGSGPIPLYLSKLESGSSLGHALSPQEQAARALTESAFGFFLRNRAPDAAEIFLRFATLLDPTHDKATLWLGSLVEEHSQDDALKLFRSIHQSSPYIVTSKLSQANVFFDRDEDEAALDILEDANRQHPSFTTRESLGRARLIRENYKDALPLYDALVQSMSDDELEQNVQPLYFRGICHEREKQWDLAVKDFQRVLELDPDNADALNYLGYTWVDRNENLTEAFDMIRKAVELEPRSGAIVDSLGWAHYKLGQYPEAKVQLEKATELAPSSATIIDHLGDVYWKLGRFREAGYQWERALEFDPTDEERQNINSKLKGGLEAVSAAP